MENGNWKLKQMKKIVGEKVSWGIVGVGDVCEVKSAPAMQLIEHSELVAVMRRNSHKAADYAQRHGVPKWYDDADRLINDPDINAIYIATPPNKHAFYTLQAAKAGKHVYVEKPMARSVEECNEMIKACEEANVQLYVAYYRRRLPNFEKLKSLILEGYIGDIRLVKLELYKTVDPDILSNITSSMPVNWRIDPEIAGGGYFYDLAAHQLDYLDYVFGPIQSVQGMAENQAGHYRAADTITGNFKFENGILGIGSWCFSVAQVAEKDQLTIIGSEGQISISFFGKPQIRIEHINSSKNQILEFSLPRHIQHPLIQTIVDDLHGIAKCPSTGITAARTNSVMQEITKNYY